MPHTATWAEASKSFGPLCREAQQSPVIITRRGSPSLVLLSLTEYERLKRRDRQVLTIDQIPIEVRDAVAAARWRKTTSCHS